MKKGSTDCQLQSRLTSTNILNQNATDSTKNQAHKSADQHFFIRVYKTLFQYLISISEEFIQGFILEQSECRKILSEYLKRTLNNTGEVASIYGHAIEEFKNLLAQKINEHWAGLFEDRKSRYNEIARQVTQRLRNSNDYKTTELNGMDMLKLDFLSLFLQRNSRYREACRRLISNFAYPLTISRVFDIQKSDIILHLKQFEAVKGQLVFWFREKYEEIIMLFFIIELKYKTANYMQRDGKIKYKNAKCIELLTEHLKATDKTDSEFRIKFNFCEVAYYPKIDPRSRPITSATIGKRTELMDDLQKIAKLPSIVKMKQQLIKLAEASVSSVCILNEWLQIIRNPQSQLYLTTFSKELKLKNELYKCQWSFIHNDQCLNTLSKLSGQPLSTKEVYFGYKNSYILMNLMKIIIKRSQLLSKVLKTQLKLETRKPIFINKYQFCYNDITHCGQQTDVPVDNEQASLKVTLVLGVLCSSVLFFSVTNGQLIHDQYCNIIKDFVVKLSKIQPPTNLVVCDEGLIGIGFYPFLRSIQTTYGTKLFVTNDDEYFSYHISTQASLFLRLRSMRALICKENFYLAVRKEIVILYGAISTIKPNIFLTQENL